MNRLTCLLRIAIAPAALILAAGCGRGPESAPAQSGHITIVETKKIVVQASSPDPGTVEIPMVIEDNPDASGGKCLVVPEGAGKPGGDGPGKDKEVFGKAVYTINVAQDGKYIFWGRVFWNNGCGNSFKIGIDDLKPIEFGDDIYKRWHWVKGSAEQLTAGQHRITIFNREAAVKMDEFLLTNDTEYIPTGIE